MAACPADTPVTAEFVIGSYHQLFQIEKSFRMSKHDLQARPIYHRKRDSIEAHLTTVLAALANPAPSLTVTSANLFRHTADHASTRRLSHLYVDAEGSLVKVTLPAVKLGLAL